MSIYDANVNPSGTFKMYKKLAQKPFGNGLFSLVASAKAPYFLTVQPRLQELLSLIHI